MKLGWFTDLHLDHLTPRPGEDLMFAARKVIRQALKKLDDIGAVVITGDIANGKYLRDMLAIWEEVTSLPVYFVTGNHDYYFSSIKSTDLWLRKQYGSGQSKMTFLGEGGIIPLDENVCLIGHRGWADGQAGEGRESEVELNDFRLIEELKQYRHNKRGLFNHLQELGRESADTFSKVLPGALESYGHVIIATHVPPFPEATLYEGKRSSPDYLPHFCNDQAGVVIKQITSRHPKKKVTILCGHTHCAGDVEILPNLRVRIGHGDYDGPREGVLVGI